ncbi:MAG: ATP-binding protein [Thermoanaerobaculales bacterium]|nr:ATP-binding protein [Thermoanaerobaculales bacterium]
MRIGIASGKGGTGKTTVATNLARTAVRRGRRVAYLDCDVEEPNGQIYLRPEIAWRRPVTLPVPVVDPGRCDGCGACGEICRFSAIVCVAGKVLVFPRLCHSCGGCSRVCPVDAIGEDLREVGVVSGGQEGKLAYRQGLLNVGEAMSPPLIRAVRAVEPVADLVVVDAPPGTSCAAVEALRGCDRVLLVTEPTPFARHDLELALDTVAQLGIPAEVVVNRAGRDGARTLALCERYGVEIVAELPDRRSIAEASSRGELAVEIDPEFEEWFQRLLAHLEDRR